MCERVGLGRNCAGQAIVPAPFAKVRDRGLETFGYFVRNETEVL